MMRDRNQNANTWAMFCHLSSFLWFLLVIVGLPIPLLANIVGPLVIWLLKKDESEFVDRHGRESLNFQISMTLYGIALITAAIVTFLLYLIIAGGLANTDGGAFAWIAGALGGIGWLILVTAFSLVQLILVIVATVQASQGKFYRYPLTLRFIRDRR
jgi:uncharacterized Tic20 family protein